MAADVKFGFVVAFLLSFVRKKMNLVVARCLLAVCVIHQHRIGHAVRIVGFKRHRAGSNPDAQRLGESGHNSLHRAVLILFRKTKYILRIIAHDRKHFRQQRKIGALPSSLANERFCNLDVGSDIRAGCHLAGGNA